MYVLGHCCQQLLVLIDSAIAVQCLEPTVSYAEFLTIPSIFTLAAIRASGFHGLPSRGHLSLHFTSEYFGVAWYEEGGVQCEGYKLRIVGGGNERFGVSWDFKVNRGACLITCLFVHFTPKPYSNY